MNRKKMTMAEYEVLCQIKYEERLAAGTEPDSSYTCDESGDVMDDEAYPSDENQSVI